MVCFIRKKYYEFTSMQKGILYDIYGKVYYRTSMVCIINYIFSYLESNIMAYCVLFKVVLCTVFFLQKFDYNCYLFQKIAIYNDERQMTMLAAKIK